MQVHSSWLCGPSIQTSSVILPLGGEQVLVHCTSSMCPLLDRTSPPSIFRVHICSLVFLNKGTRSRFKKVHRKVVLSPLRSPRSNWTISQRHCSKLKSIYQGYITLLIFWSVADDLPISKAGILAATRPHMLSSCFLRVKIGIPIYRSLSERLGESMAALSRHGLS